MARIDHIVHAVTDLDAAAKRYRTLGFTVTDRADHPFGTSNRLVVLESCYLELVAVTRPNRIPRSGGFAAEVDRSLRTAGPGIPYLALGCDDPEGDRIRLLGLGLTTGEVFGFSRPAPLLDGGSTEATFSLLFTDVLDDPRLFLCHHHTPEAVWQPAATRHANTASRVTRVAFRRSLTDGEHRRLDALTGTRGSPWELDGTELVFGSGGSPEIGVDAPVRGTVAGVEITGT